MRRTLCIAAAATLYIAASAAADQMICTHWSAFDEGMSTVEDAGNTWTAVDDAESYTGTAFTAPGEADTGGGPDRPWLVYVLPEPVKAGEGTADGKTWQIWLHMRVITDQNSFYFGTSQDGSSWWPDVIDNTVRINNDDMNNTDEWFWADQVTGNDGGLSPLIEVGQNYIRLGPRETTETTDGSPRFDVVCLRNFGDLGLDAAPADADVQPWLDVTPVEAQGKLATTWAAVRRSL
jgi:hypothetical protein